MKKRYEAPAIEVVKFEYKDQVVANSGGSDSCYSTNEGYGTCHEWIPAANQQ